MPLACIKTLHASSTSLPPGQSHATDVRVQRFLRSVCQWMHIVPVLTIGYYSEGIRVILTPSSTTTGQPKTLSTIAKLNQK